MTGSGNQGLAAPGISRTQHLAIALYERGHSARDVGELLDLPRPAVSELVTKAGISRGRDEAARLAQRNRQVRVHVQHVTLLCDVLEDVAAKLNIAVDLLLAVLTDRLGVNDRANCARASAAVPGVEKPVCVDVCLFGCTHRCAMSLTG